MKEVDRMIDGLTKQYVTPLKLEEVYREMENYLNLDDNLDKNMILSKFMEIIIKQWVLNTTERLQENCPCIFENILYPSNEDINKTILNYLLKIKNNKIEFVNKEDMLSDIESKIVNNYNWGDNLDYDDSFYLKAIKFDNLIDLIYNLGFDNISYHLESLINDLYDKYKFYKINDFKSTEILFNIFPKQNEEDQGGELGRFLDYVAIKLNSNIKDPYRPYYIHYLKPNVPICLKWLFETQGYVVEDLYNKEKVDSSPFLKSVIKSILDKKGKFQFLAFGIKTNLENLHLFINKKEFTISKNTSCGFINTIHGLIYKLNIKLEKDIKISFDIQKEIFHIENSKNLYSYGYEYMISHIYKFDKDKYTKIDY